MNDIILNFATILLLLTLYGVTYKGVSAAFKAVADRKNAIKAEQEKTQRLERLKQDIMTLSNKEIAVLKFILSQAACIAWLPEHHKHVLLLRSKDILCLFCSEEKDISNKSLYYSDFGSFAQMYTITDKAKKLLTQMQMTNSKKWRKVKPDYTFSDFQ